MNKLYLKINLIFLLLLIPFTWIQGQTTADLVAQEAIGFPQDSKALPDEMLSAIGSASYLLVGETHYIQEHYDFLCTHLPEFYRLGYRSIGLEFLQSTGWLYDEYVKGIRLDLIPDIKNINLTFLEAIKDFNKDLRNQGKSADQISVFCFDMNHGGAGFPYALSELLTYSQDQISKKNLMERLINPQASFQKYQENLLELKKELENGKNFGFNPENQALLLSITTIEIRSVPNRLKENHITREKSMFDNIQKYLENSPPGDKVLIDCGMQHAQLKTFWYPSPDRNYVALGEWMKVYAQEKGQQLYSLAVVPLKGILKSSINQRMRFTVNKADLENQNDLTRVLARKFPEQNIFLDLSRKEFSQYKITVSYTNDAFTEIPGEHFSGLLCYPHATVQKSTLFYER